MTLLLATAATPARSEPPQRVATGRVERLGATGTVKHFRVPIPDGAEALHLGFDVRPLNVTVFCGERRLVSREVASKPGFHGVEVEIRSCAEEGAVLADTTFHHGADPRVLAVTESYAGAEGNGRGFPGPAVLRELARQVGGGFPAWFDAGRQGSYGQSRDPRMLVSCEPPSTVAAGVACARKLLGGFRDCYEKYGARSGAERQSLALWLDREAVVRAARYLDADRCEAISELEPSPSALESAQVVLDGVFETLTSALEEEGAMPSPPPAVGSAGTELRPALRDYSALEKALRKSCSGRDLLSAIDDRDYLDPQLGISFVVQEIEDAVEWRTGLLADGTDPLLLRAAVELKRAPKRKFCDRLVGTMVLIDEWSARLAETPEHVPLVDRLRKAKLSRGEDPSTWLAEHFPDLFRDASGALERIE